MHVYHLLIHPSVCSLYVCYIQMLPQKSTIGAINPPLGNTRLQTIHLLTAIIEANDAKINQELLRLNTLSILLVNLLIFYQRNFNSIIVFNVGFIFSIPMEQFSSCSSRNVLGSSF